MSNMIYIPYKPSYVGYHINNIGSGALQKKKNNNNMMLEEPDLLYFTYRIKLNTYYHTVNSTTTHITRMNI